MAKVNFQGLGHRSRPADSITDPRDLFNALPGKIANLTYLRGPQDQVLASWHERRRERDLVIKMNTGGGKTLVGLLIARSWLNEGISPVAYLVPDKFLTEQVIAEASKAGIATTVDVNPDYEQGRAVLVAPFSKLFNGRSVFGVSSSVFKTPISGLGGLIVDDAHACLGQADQIFRLRIGQDSEEYDKLLDLFSLDLKVQSPNGFLDLMARRPRALQEVPFWTWQEKQDKVLAILNPISERTLKWEWPLVVDSLPFCTAVVTSDAFEIYPPCHNTDALLGFTNANRRVYLTATLTDDSVLVRHFGADRGSVSSPIFPSSASDIGERMILVPQQLVPTATDEDVRDLVVRMAAERNVVVIVPSRARAEWWENNAAQTLDRDNIREGVERLRNDPRLGLTVLINRYDGIDLPDDACHILVLDGLPEALAGQERLAQAHLTDSTALLGRQVQRLEQGMGRATRSNQDYAVILLLGARLAERLHSLKARNLFSPATRAQLQVAEDIANEVGQGSLDDLVDVMRQCLGRDADWVEYSKGALAQVRYESSPVAPEAEFERKAFALALGHDYPGAAESLQQAVNRLGGDPAAQAVQRQGLAAYTNFFNPNQAQQIQKSANTANRRLLRPIAGVQYQRLKGSSRSQGEQASSWLQAKYSSSNEILLGLNAVIQDLDWGPRTDQFEQAIRDVGDHIGHVGQQPEALLGRGPDVLWSLTDGTFFVIEAKSGAEHGHPVYKKDAEQLSNAMDWFRQQYPSSTAHPVLIHPQAKFDSHAAIPSGCRVITASGLQGLRERLRSFAQGLSVGDAFRDPARVTSLLNDYGLSQDQFICRFTNAARH